MIPRPLRVQDVIAEAQPVGLRLPPELERVQRRRRARSEQVNRVSVTLRLEEPPNGANLQKLSGPLLHFLDLMEQLQRFRLALDESLLEISLVSEMPSIQHERVDVTPHL